MCNEVSCDCRFYVWEKEGLKDSMKRKIIWKELPIFGSQNVQKLATSFYQFKSLKMCGYRNSEGERMARKKFVFL